MAPDSVIIGGSSGMGKAAAKACVRAGGRVLLASRDGDKLAAAQREVIRDCDASQERVRTAVLDARDEAPGARGRSSTPGRVGKHRRLNQR